MLKDAGKSIDSILKDRLTSPLYGTFFFSWSVWNWQIIYLTVFVSQEFIRPYTKIEFILKYYLNWHYLITYPLISTIVLILGFPYVANLALKIHLYYEKKKRMLTDDFDNGKLLTLEQSALIRNNLRTEQEIHFKEIQSKEMEIQVINKQLNLEVEKNQTLQVEMDQRELKNKELKLVYARYGIKDRYIDVTLVLQSMIGTVDKFLVNNNTMGKDPFHGQWKELQIVYLSGSVGRNFIAKEYFEVSFSGGFFEARETEESAKVYDFGQLNKLFPGKWKAQYSGDNPFDEEFEIRGRGYFKFDLGRAAIHIYDFKHVYVVPESNEILLDRVNITNNSEVSLSIRVIEEGRSYETNIENKLVTFIRMI